MACQRRDARRPAVRRSAAACPFRPAAPARPTSANALASRCASPSPRWGMICQARVDASGHRRRRARAPVGRPRSPATTSSVSLSAAAASRAACSGRHGGHSRVLQRPGRGSLAITSRAMPFTPLLAAASGRTPPFRRRNPPGRRIRVRHGRGRRDANTWRTSPRRYWPVTTGARSVRRRARPPAPCAISRTDRGAARWRR